MIIVFFVLTASYILLIGSFIFGFKRVKTFIPSEEFNALKFSIIIPFRNEIENLENLINSLDELYYKKHLFEVIFINDNSSDNSEELALRLLSSSQLDFHIYNNDAYSVSPKKDAITLGINKSKYDWILTTDADCTAQKKWLCSLNNFINEHNVEMVISPVMLNENSSVFGQFQTLEILSLQGITMAGFGLKNPIMCNGANFCYSKKLFYSLNGFEGNTNMASGDDIFLMEKAILQNKTQVGYLKSKDAIIETKPESSFSKMLQQRIRWAAKSTAYKSKFTKLIGLIIVLMNFLIVSTLTLTILGLIQWWYFLLILSLKLLIDYSLISSSASFFNRKIVLNSYLFSGLIYPFVSIYVTYKAIFSNYKWKGRTFSK